MSSYVSKHRWYKKVNKYATLLAVEEQNDREKVEIFIWTVSYLLVPPKSLGRTIVYYRGVIKKCVFIFHLYIQLRLTKFLVNKNRKYTYVHKAFLRNLTSQK